ncbi:MAG: GNAT family protein [Alphaproteobacteria bacterium]
MDVQLQGPRVFLRMGEATDWHAWRSVRETSRDFLTPWEPSWPHNALTNSFFSGMLRRNWRDWRNGRAYPFFIFKKAQTGQKPELIGGISLNDVQGGIAQKGVLGYWIGEKHARQGYMTEAAALLCDFAYQTLHLHRVEASCLPSNLPSQALLQRLGFEEEGYAKAYLQINGKWEDHVLWGRRSPRPQHNI